MRDAISPSLSDHFRTTLYLPVLDAMLSELERRFSDKNLMHMRAFKLVPHDHHIFWNQINNLLLLLILMASIKPLWKWSVH